MQKHYMRREQIENDKIAEVVDSSVSESVESQKAMHNSKQFQLSQSVEMQQSNRQGMAQNVQYDRLNNQEMIIIDVSERVALVEGMVTEVQGGLLEANAINIEALPVGIPQPLNSDMRQLKNQPLRVQLSTVARQELELERDKLMDFITLWENSYFRDSKLTK